MSKRKDASESAESAWSALSLEQLRSWAGDNGVDLPARAKKAEIVSILAASGHLPPGAAAAPAGGASWAGVVGTVVACPSASVFTEEKETKGFLLHHAISLTGLPAGLKMLAWMLVAPDPAGSDFAVGVGVDSAGQSALTTCNLDTGAFASAPLPFAGRCLLRRLAGPGPSVVVVSSTNGGDAAVIGGSLSAPTVIPLRLAAPPDDGSAQVVATAKVGVYQAKPALFVVREKTYGEYLLLRYDLPEEGKLPAELPVAKSFPIAAKDPTPVMALDIYGTSAAVVFGDEFNGVLTLYDLDTGAKVGKPAKLKTSSEGPMEALLFWPPAGMTGTKTPIATDAPALAVIDQEMRTCILDAKGARQAILKTQGRNVDNISLLHHPTDPAQAPLLACSIEQEEIVLFDLATLKAQQALLAPTKALDLGAESAEFVAIRDKLGSELFLGPSVLVGSDLTLAVPVGNRNDPVTTRLTVWKRGAVANPDVLKVPK